MSTRVTSRVDTNCNVAPKPSERDWTNLDCDTKKMLSVRPAMFEEAIEQLGRVVDEVAIESNRAASSDNRVLKFDDACVLGCLWFIDIFFKDQLPHEAFFTAFHLLSHIGLKPQNTSRVHREAGKQKQKNRTKQKSTKNTSRIITSHPTTTHPFGVHCVRGCLHTGAALSNQLVVSTKNYQQVMVKQRCSIWSDLK